VKLQQKLKVKETKRQMNERQIQSFAVSTDRYIQEAKGREKSLLCNETIGSFGFLEAGLGLQSCPGVRFQFLFS